jgi:excisionase family DNA binding protein
VTTLLSEDVTKAIAEAVRAEVAKMLPVLERAVASRPSAAPSAFLSVNETLNLLHISRTQLYRLFKDETIKPVKRGGSTLVHRDDLERYVSELRAGEGAARVDGANGGG